MTYKRLDPETGKYERMDTVTSRSCPGKASISKKKVAAARAKRLSRELGEPIEFYHCYRPGCGYHVGHPAGWRRENGMAPSSISRIYAERD